MEPTKYQIDLYKKLLPILGITGRVTKYGDDENNEVRILSCSDPLDETITFYGTLGLSEKSIEKNQEEIFFVSYAKFEQAPNILSTSAFFVLNNSWKTEVGGVFETLVEMYYPNEEMKHIYFTTPFLWEDKLENFKINEKSVNFLLAIPISDNELNYKNENGYLELERLFEENEIDIFDLKRKSII